VNRQFWLCIGVGLVAASLLQQRQKGSLTQERLDAYYHRRAGNYNATDNLYLLGRYPRIELREAVLRATIADLEWKKALTGAKDREKPREGL